jgi:hypothetical protein
MNQQDIASVRLEQQQLTHPLDADNPTASQDRSRIGGQRRPEASVRKCDPFDDPPDALSVKPASYDLYLRQFWHGFPTKQFNVACSRTAAMNSPATDKPFIR